MFFEKLNDRLSTERKPEAAKKLNDLVKREKNLLRAVELCANERKECAKQLSAWGNEQEEDVSDVSDKLGVLIYEIAELEDKFIDRHDQYRITLKSIRDLEASVQTPRDRKVKILQEIARLKYKQPDSPQITIKEQELVRAEAESLVAEAQLSNTTREKVKSAFEYHFDALAEYAEKVGLIAGYGRALLNLIDDTPVTPGETRPQYDGYEASKQIIIDAETALSSWTQTSAQIHPTLTIRDHGASENYENSIEGDVGEHEGFDETVAEQQ